MGVTVWVCARGETCADWIPAVDYKIQNVKYFENLGSYKNVGGIAAEVEKAAFENPTYELKRILIGPFKEPMLYY